MTARARALGTPMRKRRPLESQGEYQHDKKEGIWRYFSFEGKPSAVISCRSGRANGPYRAWAELDVPHVSAQLHYLFLRGAFRDGEPIGSWWVSHPGERSQEIVCKLDEYCRPPVGLWGDLSDGCDTLEFQPD